MQWLAQAPSNIALIKYMGKKEEAVNLPANPSLSYTLPHLLSTVSLEIQPGKKDYWEPLQVPGSDPFNLSTPAQQRFLAHLAFLKDNAGYEGGFLVKSSNNFPQGTGLASSASSFAALTKATLLALSELQGTPVKSDTEMAKLSRLGSGSSCRSFFSPWASWVDEEAQAINLPYTDLQHQVILISHAEKAVASSKAHQLIQTAPDYLGRIERATQRFDKLIEALTMQQWRTAHELCWAEFQDMHHQFTTCAQPFSYMTEDTKAVLAKLEKFWDKLGDGPLITMDAGPNIHLLYRADQTSLAREFKNHYLLGNYDLLS